MLHKCIVKYLFVKHCTYSNKQIHLNLKIHYYATLTYSQFYLFLNIAATANLLKK